MEEIKKEISLEESMELVSKFGSYTQLKSYKEEAQSQKLGLLNKDIAGEFDAVLEARLEAKTIEELQALRDEEVNAMLQFNGTDAIVLGTEIPEADVLKFKRDYLIYVSKTNASLKEMDKLIETFEEDIKADEKELDSALQQLDNVHLFMILKLDEQLKSNDITEEQRTRMTTMKESLVDTSKFKRLVELYSTLKKENVLQDFKDADKSNRLFKKYNVIAKKEKIAINIADCGGLELFLEEKYHKLENLFMFCLLRYIAYKDPKTVQKFNDGVFLSQTLLNIKRILKGELQGEYREEILNGVKEVLDLFL